MEERGQLLFPKESGGDCHHLSGFPSIFPTLIGLSSVFSYHTYYVFFNPDDYFRYFIKHPLNHDILNVNTNITINS